MSHTDTPLGTTLGDHHSLGATSSDGSCSAPGIRIAPAESGIQRRSGTGQTVPGGQQQQRRVPLAKTSELVHEFLLLVEEAHLFARAGGGGGQWENTGVGGTGWFWVWTTPDLSPHAALEVQGLRYRACGCECQTPAASPCRQPTGGFPAAVSTCSTSCRIQGPVSSIRVCSPC